MALHGLPLAHPVLGHGGGAPPPVGHGAPPPAVAAPIPGHLGVALLPVGMQSQPISVTPLGRTNGGRTVFKINVAFAAAPAAAAVGAVAPARPAHTFIVRAFTLEAAVRSMEAYSRVHQLPMMTSDEQAQLINTHRQEGRDFSLNLEENGQGGYQASLSVEENNRVRLSPLNPAHPGVRHVQMNQQLCQAARAETERLQRDLDQNHHNAAAAHHRDWNGVDGDGRDGGGGPSRTRRFFNGAGRALRDAIW